MCGNDTAFLKCETLQLHGEQYTYLHAGLIQIFIVSEDIKKALTE